MPNQTFADLGVSNAVSSALTKRGIETPFEIQKLVIEDALEGHDVLAKSPTGSGKTLAFAIPMVDRIQADGPRPAALILAPTRELVSQIVEEMRSIATARALRIAAVYGGMSINKQIRASESAHIIVATPGRLEDLLDRRAFSLRDVQVLVLDEADRMLDMGFKPAVSRIVKQCPQDRQTMFFSATLDGEIGRVARDYTTDARSHEHAPEIEHAADIEHRFIGVQHEDKIDALLEELNSGRDLALVFVRTKRGADRLAKRLGSEGISAAAMHGDKSQRQRERALASFEAFKVDTLVATDVAARGIDVDGISHVINFDPPEDRETYVHRIGRTARAGNSGIGITFVDSRTAQDVGKIAVELELETEFAESGHTAKRGGGGGNRRGGGGGGNRRGGNNRGGGNNRNSNNGGRGGNNRNNTKGRSGESEGQGGGYRGGESQSQDGGNRRGRGGESKGQGGGNRRGRDSDSQGQGGGNRRGRGGDSQSQGGGNRRGGESQGQSGGRRSRGSESDGQGGGYRSGGKQRAGQGGGRNKRSK